MGSRGCYVGWDGERLREIAISLRRSRGCYVGWDGGEQTDQFDLSAVAVAAMWVGMVPVRD